MSVPKKVLVVLALALLQMRVEAAPADPTPPGDESAELFRHGLAEYDAGHYRSAIDIFTRVYDRTQSAALLFNIAQAWRLLGNCSKAVASYEAFIAGDPASPNVQRAQNWLTKLRPCSDGPPSASAPDAPKPAPETTAPRLTVAPPTVASRRLVSPPETAPRTSGLRSMLVGALGGASIVLAGGAAYAAWHAHDLGNQVSSSFTNGGTWDAQAASLDRDGKHAQTEAIVLLASAVVCGAAALVIHFLSGSSNGR